jgi:hypothetical protein
MSECRVEDVVDVATQGCGVDEGELRPTPAELVERSGRPRECDELRDRLPGTSDRESLAALSSRHDLTPVVPQVPDGDI